MRGFRLRLAVVAVLGIAIAGPTIAATKVPESRTIRNWHAFTRLYGYVRWFHPSDEAAATDWDGFAILGARTVRDIANDADLRRALIDLFTPIAPSLLVFETGKAPPPEPIAAPADSPMVAWQHKGVGWGASTTAYSPYKSGRTNRDRIDSPGFGTVTAGVEAAPLRGRTVRLRCAMRAEVASGKGTGQMWIRVDLPEKRMGFFDNMKDRPVTSPEWTDVEITGTIEADAVAISIGALLQGQGVVEVDDFRLDAKRADGSWEPVSLTNGGFETGSGSSAPGWYVPTTGYHGTIITRGVREGRQAMRITSEEAGGALFDTRPARGERFERDLVPGLRCRVLLSVTSVDGHTLPSADVFKLGRLRAEIDGVNARTAAAGDEAVRVAGIAVLWNVTQHFWPYFDVVSPDWDGALDRALTRALQDRTAEDHAHTLRLMTALLEDGHVNVWPQIRPTRAWTPLVFEWAEGRLVVSDSGDSLARRGDVVRSIDGRSANALLDSVMVTRSGTERWRRNQALRLFDRGAPGTAARLEIERGSKVSSIAIPRSEKPAVPPRTPDPVVQLEPGIWYVDLERSRMSQIDSVMTELARAKGVVFDARGYPNGTHLVLSHLADSLLQSAIWRVPRIIRPDHVGPAEWDESGRWSMPPLQPRLEGKIVFLIGPGAISYAESVMGVVEAYHLGELVGEATAGCNGNVNRFVLPGGINVGWTGMRVLKHDGSEHMSIGIRPTVPVARTIAGIRSGHDEVLERGVEIARGGTPVGQKP